VKKLFAVLVIGSLTIVGCEKPASSVKPASKPLTTAPGASPKDDAAKDKMIKDAADKAKADAEKKDDKKMDDKKAPDAKDAKKDK